MSEQATPFRLDPADRKQIEKRRNKEKDSRAYTRHLALLWLDDGKPIDEVAILLDRDPPTLRKLAAWPWLKLLEKKGPAGSIISAIAETSET